MKPALFPALLVLLATSLPGRAFYDVIGVYLTWQRDPATTMTVNWVNLYAEGAATIWYRPAGEKEWLSATGKQHVAAPSVLQVRRVELTGLLPDTIYQFVPGEQPPKPPAPAVAPASTPVAKKVDEEEVEKEWKPPVVPDTRSTYHFRTMPAELTRPVRFVAGGDMMHTREMVDAMNKRAAALDPDFALLGGDLAYANGADAARWIDWMQSWMKNARGKGGRLIPMVVGIGNHEVRGGYKGRIPEDAPYFYGFFALPENRSYYALDFGRYLSFLVLDTGHTQPISGPQAEWLGGALTARAEQHFLFPVYHWPAYGTSKEPNGKLPSESKRSIEIRNQWIPHFERHGVTAVFENDHHNYKRTYPIRGHQRDDKTGLVYLGDGAWGVNTRTVPKDAWYLAKTEPRRHLYHVTLPLKGPVTVEAIDAKGVVFDKTSFVLPRTVPVAPAN
ncbi:MAG: hypothetical protein JWQ44_2586 [Chthoniobacter sp.]|nr:hypothetical protein [Chthoniobacter sp.]